MQRITNCILIDDDRILMIKKPRRGWYAIPGGKMEQGETIIEGATREFKEETNLKVQDIHLRGVFSFLIFNDERKLINEWMMFTFVSHLYEGTLASYCREGELEWISTDEILTIPMAEGDRKIFEHVLTKEDILYATFSYTEDERLIEFRES